MDKIQDRGDRATLSFTDLEILETKVIPTAKRWIVEYRNGFMAENARKTLAYWGEV